jgi:hypothetical protein
VGRAALVEKVGADLAGQVASPTWSEVVGEVGLGGKAAKR